MTIDTRHNDPEITKNTNNNNNDDDEGMSHRTTTTTLSPPDSPQPQKCTLDPLTTGFQGPILPDTHYKISSKKNVALWKRLLIEVHYCFCLSLWFGLVFAPVILLAVLWFELWITSALLYTAYFLSFLPKLFPKWFQWFPKRGFRHFLFTMINSSEMFSNGLYIHYTHGALEVLAYRNKPADYVVELPLSGPQYRPDDCDVLVPQDQFTTQFQHQYNIYNDMTTINKFPMTSTSLSALTSPGVVTTTDPPYVLDRYEGDKVMVAIHNKTQNEGYNQGNNLPTFYKSLPPSTTAQLSKPVLLIGLPHGIYCVSFYLGGVGNRSLDRMNSTFKWCVADGLTQMPFFQYIHHFKRKLWSASGSNVKEYMRNKEDLALAVGGFHEASIFQYNKYHVYLQTRHGFIAYALRYGYNIIPFFGFGEEKCYHNHLYTDDKKSFLGKIIKFLNDKDIPAIAPTGKYYISQLPMNDHQMDIVYGAPLFLPQIDQPTDQQVKYWHGIFIERVKELFQEWKIKLKLPEDSELKIH